MSVHVVNSHGNGHHTISPEGFCFNVVSSLAVISTVLKHVFLYIHQGKGQVQLEVFFS